MITAFIGVMGSGKDYQANMLVDKGAVMLNFKDALLDMTEDLMGFSVRGDYELFKESLLGFTYPGTNHSHWYAPKMTRDVKVWFPNAMTGRDLLQRLGTDVIRKRDPDYWVKEFTKRANELMELGKDIVCSDCRFHNEVETIMRLGTRTSSRQYKFIFCNHKSDRYKANVQHESEFMAQTFLNAGYEDLEEILIGHEKDLC